MNLTIDQGNTSTKIAVFYNDDLQYVARMEQLTATAVETLFQQFPIDKVIVSSVADNKSLPLPYLSERVPVTLLNADTPLPIANCYGTPRTLGMDRLAACVGANYLRRDSNLLVVDLGTCITFDVVDSQNRYLGGNISPGLQMRLQALHQFTQALPLVSLDEDNPVPVIGSNTQDAIRAGVVQAIVYEIEGYAKALASKYPNLSIFLTGGDSFYFERRVKSAIFANPNLLLIGLNRILNF